jgi:hypothetical protein
MSFFAQEAIVTTYSFYGWGCKVQRTLENRSMAGVAGEQDSIHMNIQNPASYAKILNTTLGGTYATASNFKNTTESAKATRTTLDYMAGCLGKLGVGFGLIPYSSVGYKIKYDAENDTENSTF